MGTKKKGIFMS